MKNKKFLYITTSIIAVVCLVAGLFLIVNPFNNQPEPTPPAPEDTNPPKTMGEIKNSLDKLTTDEKYQEAVNKYSQYLNLSGSEPGNRYYSEFVIPGVAVVGEYVNNAFFNKYFVSDYWDTKDKRSGDAIKEFISPLVTENVDTNIIKAGEDKTVPVWDSLRDKIFIPDPSFKILEGCAEKWEELDCFTIPPQIKSITLKGETENVATYTVNFQMDLVYQDPNQQEGVLTRQTRNYTLKLSVENTNLSLKDMKMSDIKIRDISGSLDIKNINDVGTEQ